MRVDREKAGEGSGNAVSGSGTAPLKPKAGLNGPPTHRTYHLTDVTFVTDNDPGLCETIGLLFDNFDALRRERRAARSRNMN